ncbi:hypothetical protein GQR58_025962 [Nymphon striatum]|nr:hypothetical protein GQR58_025962 [Nymphon striatum]
MHTEDPNVRKKAKMTSHLCVDMNHFITKQGHLIHHYPGTPKLNRSHSQRSVSTTTGDLGDKHESSTVDRRHRRSNRTRDDVRSPSPSSSKSPSHRYYLGEDPWRGSPTPRDERSHSRSGDMRKEAVKRFYEQNRRDYSPASRNEDTRNRKDLYAWEDHRSRDFYSHTTKLDDEERDAYLNQSRHESGTGGGDSGDYKISSYSPTPAGPTYSVSAHSRSENRDRDPDDPHKQVYKTTSKSQSDDIHTTPMHDGSKNVTHSKVRQNHYRSEMKYGDRGLGSSPPNSPPPTDENMYHYDDVDYGSYDRRNRTRESNTSFRSSHDNLYQSENRRQEYVHDLHEDLGYNRYENGYSSLKPSMHYKPPSERQRHAPRERSPEVSSYKDETVHLTPDYSNRSRRLDDYPEDPVLKPPKFTPLQSPLSVKTADESKTPHSFHSKFDRDNESLRDTESSFFKSSKDDSRYKSNFEKENVQEIKDDSRYKPIFEKENVQEIKDDDRYVSKYTVTLPPLKKLDQLPEKYDSIKKKPEKPDTPPTLKKFVDLKPVRQPTPEPIKLPETTFGDPSRYSRSSRRAETPPPPKKFENSTIERKQPSPEPTSLPANTNEFPGYQSRYGRSHQQSVNLTPPVPRREKKMISVEPVLQAVIQPDVTNEPPLFNDSMDKDNESVKSDKSRTSTHTFILEDSNTNSLKKVHVNTGFRRDAAPPPALQKRSVKPITEEIPSEPMKQILKVSSKKKAPVPVPSKTGRSEIINTDTFRKKAPPVAPKRTKGSHGAKTAKEASFS